MKKLIFISGTMGVGKTTVAQTLKKNLNQAVFLDGDWCWDMHPFNVNQETKDMVMDNIGHILNNFIHCSQFENIIFCWVMQEQSIFDDLISLLDVSHCEVYSFSLICSEKKLREHLKKDIQLGVRESDIMERSCAYLKLYEKLNTDKINVSNLSIEDVVDEIKSRLL